MEFQFPNPKFGNEITVYIVESEFHYPNPNSSETITVPIFEWECPWPNLSIGEEIADSKLQSERQNYDLCNKGAVLVFELEFRCPKSWLQ